jgi:CO/xanthine dehydrogenase Mo-binding subunit
MAETRVEDPYGDVREGIEYEVKVLKIAASHDCGKAINPMLVEGQLEESVVGGMGQALYENGITDHGQVLNPSFLDDGIPTAMEVPSIASVEAETNDPAGRFGEKASGEGTQSAPAPAIINTIYDAIGVRFKSLPVTPEKILQALYEKEKKVEINSLDDVRNTFFEEINEGKNSICILFNRFKPMG